jgi:hypothetical protein
MRRSEFSSFFMEVFMATEAQKRAAPKKTQQNETKIVLQVGTELRIKNNGDITIDNPELELVGDDQAADAILLYRFNAEAGEHVIRLLDPVADRAHMKKHRPND